GKLSDIVGRRPILLSSATALLVGTLLVGFSFSFLWTVGVLFFEGFLNGTLVVAKTYLYECPVLGGFLACPATRFRTFDKPFFKQFPYILPCAVVACLEFCILIGGCIYLGESLNKKPKYDYISLKQISTQDVAEDEKENSHRQEESTISLLRDRLVLISCALYALYALAGISSSQLLPLLLVSDPQHGGYNCNAAEIALVLTTLAIYSGITQATLNPYIASKFTYKSVYVSGVVLHAVGIILLPSMVNITGAMSSQHVANQTETSSDLTLNFAADSEHALISPPARESRVQPTLQHISASSQFVVATAEVNATAARSLIGQCRLDGDSRKGASKRPASELQASVWGPLLLVILLMEQGSHQSALVAIVMVGNAGVVSNVPPTIIFPSPSD
ncbi:PREDICTED: protein ZINC INDUCED FACILITATOR-LIKE 1-like, partial [Branchiostoma belcheri]|uniref:Protein ZINC INDUCED FACILITATOR-LIKE 1-like n=1 Tax=Branchiostoma belcheri TaxID=7741 RepID=A0A6P4Z855_BRABE